MNQQLIIISSVRHYLLSSFHPVSDDVATCSVEEGGRHPGNSDTKFYGTFYAQLPLPGFDPFEPVSDVSIQPQIHAVNPGRVFFSREILNAIATQPEVRATTYIGF